MRRSERPAWPCAQAAEKTRQHFYGRSATFVLLCCVEQVILQRVVLPRRAGSQGRPWGSLGEVVATKWLTHRGAAQRADWIGGGAGRAPQREATGIRRKTAVPLPCPFVIV